MAQTAAIVKQYRAAQPDMSYQHVAVACLLLQIDRHFQLCGVGRGTGCDCRQHFSALLLPAVTF